MSGYVSHTKAEIEEMLSLLGVSDAGELFRGIDDSIKIGPLNLEGGKSQQEVFSRLLSLAEKNKAYKTMLRGAGSYDHFIPSVVKSLASRSEFLTAYTPYQAEISQGILQAIFEYQTYITLLTGMDVSNASHYSGFTAAAEAALMTNSAQRDTLIFPDNLNPDLYKVLKTYLEPRGVKITLLPTKDGLIDLDTLKNMDGSGVCAVIIGQPNYFGLIEDMEAVANAAHAMGAKLIAYVNPTAMGLLKTPGECGADIAVGDAQPLGLPLNFGGPYVGFMACKAADVRKLPGRIVGETTDHDGNKAYVLTLQAREQHIRRERASSNICSNQAHCALTVTIYLAAMGSKGLKAVAQSCVDNAHYLSDCLESIGLKRKHNGEFFHEFVTLTNGKSDVIEKALSEKGILSGLKISDNEMLWCATEKASKKSIDEAVEIIKACL